MRLEGLASNENYAVTQLGMETLVVELVENVLKMTWKIHLVTSSLTGTAIS